eukprot:TRINITY_DN76901_c0_g1_i1.p1 TRINITY_DN76901_c0_g1~~TRINITY_DN76901_c0_g1_i1.p1  ORF type:complete len:201 (-),score=38.78 TRINITY_DN76901_c0_g1_i1:118-720(-)
MGAGGSIFSGRSGGYAPPKPIAGSKICDDEQLKQLLKGWRGMGMTFAGVTLLAEGKERHEDYDADRNKFHVTETVFGRTGLVIKTQGDGWLHMRVGNRGFEWEHLNTYRWKETEKKAAPLQVVDSSVKRFQLEEFEYMLECQRYRVYEEGTECDYATFATYMFYGLARKRPEEEKPCTKHRDAVDHHLNMMERREQQKKQ